jgi:hypothetical protein
MAKLEEVEHPKPLREFLYETFNAFAAAHPWVEQENVRPKSIAREMFERYQSFADYVREYGLERSEGLLLRHLMQAWKVLAQTVPDSAKTPEVVEMEDYFRELIRGIDSSLLDEWERLKNPDFVAAELGGKPARPASFDITRDADAFRRLAGPSVKHTHISEDSSQPSALSPQLEKIWQIAQVLADPEEQNDWEARFEVSLAASRVENRPVIKFLAVRPVGE